MILVEPSGVVMMGICSVQTPYCIARNPAPITAVWGVPGRIQIDVCRACLEEMIRDGQWRVQGAKIPKRYDLAVYNTQGNLTLAVEVKSQASQNGTSADAWAVGIRRNLILHSALPVAPLFLLIGYPDSFYLWRGYSISEPDKAPDFAVQETQALLPFAANGETPPQAVAAWLQAVMQASDLTAPEMPLWLKNSGLAEAIQGGQISLQSSAPTLPSLQRAA